MATIYNRELDLNARNWLTEGATPVIPDGYIQYYHNHPDYDGVIYIIGDGVTAFSSLRIYSDMRDGIVLTESRKAMDENEPSAIADVGTFWYTIMETPAEANNVYSGEITVTVDGSSSRRCSNSCEFAFVGEASARNNGNTTVKKVRPANASGIQFIKDFRWAKSDTVAGAGAKLQALIDITAATSITTTLNKNSASGGSVGAKLVDPYLDNGTVTLPDGVTTATFLPNGNLFSRINPAIRTLQGVTAYLQTTTALRLEFNFDELPYNGTILALSYTALRLQFGSTVLYTFTGAETLGGPIIDGNTVYVQITLASAASSTGDCALAGTVFTATLS